MTRFMLTCAALWFAAGVANADVFTVNRTDSGYRLIRFSDTGQFLGTLGNVGPESANGIAIGPDGYIYANGSGIGVGSIVGIDGRGNGLGRGFDVNGIPETRAVIYTQPGGMAVGPDGDLYATSNKIYPYPNSKSGLLRFSTATGKYVETVFSPPLSSTYSVDVAFGPDRRAYVATGSGIYRVTPGSTAGELFVAGYAGQIVFGPDGNLYALDTAVRKYDGQTGAPLGTVIPASTDPNFRIRSIDFGPTGELLATAYPPAIYYGLDSIYRYDATTGAPLGTLATLPGGQLNLLAVGAVPEPATAVLSLAGGVLLRRRRRHANATPAVRLPCSPAGWAVPG